jgi:hypothetical protein
LALQEESNEHLVDVAFGGPAMAKPNAPQQQVKGQMKALRAIAPTQPDDTLHKVSERRPTLNHAPGTVRVSACPQSRLPPAPTPIT